MRHDKREEEDVVPQAWPEFALSEQVYPSEGQGLGAVDVLQELNAPPLAMLTRTLPFVSGVEKTPLGMVRQDLCLANQGFPDWFQKITKL